MDVIFKVAVIKTKYSCDSNECLPETIDGLYCEVSNWILLNIRHCCGAMEWFSSCVVTMCHMCCTCLRNVLSCVTLFSCCAHAALFVFLRGPSTYTSEHGIGPGAWLNTALHLLFAIMLIMLQNTYPSREPGLEFNCCRSNFVQPILPLSFGRGTKCHWTFLSNVYGKGSNVHNRGTRDVNCIVSIIITHYILISISIPSQ